MKKRFLCALLTLIMLVSLVPVTALTASAASLSVSEAAITVLKQWNGYHSTCKEDGYIGYGTKCEVKATHGAHKLNEKQADQALRAELKELDKAVNSFASNAGLALSQNQHDALVLFSFDNGTAWSTGTGSFRSAVVNRLTGSDFLNAICRWNYGTWDDSRRMVEANMYLNGAYSSAAPSSFITVYYFAGYAEEPAFDHNGDPILDEDGNPVGTSYVQGSIGSADPIQYYDVSTHPVPQIVPTLAGHTFTGWYETTLDYNSYPDYSEWMPAGDEDPTTRVNTLTSKHNYKVLMAGWVEADPAYDPEDIKNGNVGVEVYYVIPSSQILSSTVYKVPNGDAVSKESVANYYFEDSSVRVDRDYIDSNGVRWCKLFGKDRWIKVSKVTTGNVDRPDYEVTVTVTNSYVRSRKEASIYSGQNGTYYEGQQLRIINTASGDGILWGQVAKSATDNTPIGWVALIYTNWDAVRNQSNVNQATVIATAVVNGAEYVNLRSEAGTDHQIVGALPSGTIVDLYEIKYVNGHRWGRCNTGWFSLSYADVTMLTDNNSYITDTNYLSYVFTGTLNRWARVYSDPSESSSLVKTYMRQQPGVTITQLAKVGGITWGKMSEGWVMISDEEGNSVGATLDTVEYTVTADSLTVRDNPSHGANRVDTLVKGVEFSVNCFGNQIVVTDDSVWAWAYKIGEDNISYNGWVNLAGTGVSRTNMPTLEEEEDNADILTGKMGTIVNTEKVNVRAYTAATYKKVGSLAGGTTVAVWEAENGWYKIDSNCNGEYDYEDDGWVSGQYINVFDANSADASGNGSGAAGTVETGLGIVANTYTGVNVRTGAGTGYPANGKILAGSTVEILEVKTVGAGKWGRVTQGWISMDYVTMVSRYPVAGSNTTGSANGSTTNTTASEKVIFTGQITVDGTKVYTEPKLQDIADQRDQEAGDVRYVHAGTPVTVHELLAVEETETDRIDENTTQTKTYTRYWARTNDGYIHNPGDCITLDPMAEKTYTVTSYVSTVDNELKVYTDAGSNALTGSTLNKYDTVSVTTLKIVANNLWCRVEYSDDNGDHQSGYVLMKYLSQGVVADPALNNNTNNNTNSNNNASSGLLGGTVTNGVVIGSTGNTANQGTNGYVNNTSGYRYTGKVIRTGSVNVRALPSQTAALTTTLNQGAALVIYETTVSEGMAWGRCDAGWVYLYYVDLQPCNTAVDAKVVYNENTIAYADVNCTQAAGTYARMSVVDIYEVVGSMCRTELGWVHMDNLG